jgi:hypothetical protein
MGFAEIVLLVAIFGSGAGLAIARTRRSRSMRRLAGHSGLSFARRGLESVPAEFQRTLLFLAADGGHERDVAYGTRRLGDHKVRFWAFAFAFQRDVRGEWSYVETEPPFALRSPTTVLCYEQPVEFQHMVLKKLGRSDRVTADDLDFAKNVASLTREAMGDPRGVGVAPPPPLARAAIELRELSGEYVVFGPDPVYVDHAITGPTRQLLISPASGSRELVIELVGQLVVLYTASGGAMSAADTLAMTAFGDELCHRLIGRGAEGPRGVGH